MIRVLMCGPDAESGGVATHKKRLTEALRESGVEVIPYDISGSSLRKMYLKTIGLILGAAKERIRYDIIHIQASGGMSSFLVAIFGAIVSPIVNKRLIVTFHYSKTAEFVKNHKYAFKYVLDRSGKMILVSHKQEEIISSQYRDLSEKLVVSPNGFKSSLYHPMVEENSRALLNLPLDKKIIFNVSNLIESKGHKYLILAMREIISASDNCHCYIAGKGYFRDALEEQVATLQLQDHIDFLGWIPDEQIPIWINACDFFVLPSLNEGNPTVMFETLGCGKPFVGTRVGGVPEVITSDEYGLLVEPADPEDLKAKILIALDRKWDREAILRYAGQFTWENIAQQLIGVYNEVFEGYSEH